MEPKTDYSQVDPVPHHKTVALVNNFLIQTTQFLNRFATLCEEKLNTTATHLRRLEITTTILEQKLDSIKWLSSEPSAQLEATQELPSAVPQAAAAAPAPVAAAPPPPSEPCVKEHPDYQRWFKMVRVGVPIDSVKGKMTQEGFNPAVLDDENAPISKFGLTMAPKQDEE
eukprot:TRINITY_DN7578_c0_g1_i1.p2 TRINITY_DN7578_c0_g1~~TRINITY_DN7578_c0_g1_i1.p2  ORF type:complete len:170 (+),score=30.36 TRINITY_DN7578_c0_g1_i1:38-547(+)